MHAWNDFGDDPDLLDQARRLGHDWWTRCRHPAPADAPPAFTEGWRQAVHQGHPRQVADRHVNKWLQLRWGAWQRGRAVADDVRPELIREIDVATCPVTRCTLTHATRTDTDWSVDRLNNDGAYVASNLAVMSVRANRAKGRMSFEQVLACAQGAAPIHGLMPAEWMRLAALMLGPCHLMAPLQAPALPLCASLPARSARLALQQVQRLLTEHGRSHADKNRLVKALSAAGNETSRRRLAWLADRVHAGLKAHTHGEDRWDVWLHPDVSMALEAWYASMDIAQWAATARMAGQLSASRRETRESIATWHLPAKGYAMAACLNPRAT